VSSREPVAADGDVGAVVVLEQPARRKRPRVKGTNEQVLIFMETRTSKVSASCCRAKAVFRRESDAAGAGHEVRAAVH
jgi:hypothetical protein